jgi:hypothetical protein
VSTRPVRKSPPFLIAVVALLALASAPLPAFAQGNFKVTYQVERTDAQRVELAGRVQNVSGNDAVDVYVTVEALDTSGKVLARGIAFVAASLPARGEADFSARVPNVPGTTGFRVGVSSFRFGLRRSESP